MCPSMFDSIKDFLAYMKRLGPFPDPDMSYDSESSLSSSSSESEPEPPTPRPKPRPYCPYPKRVYVTSRGRCFHRQNCACLTAADYFSRAIGLVLDDGYEPCQQCFASSSSSDDESSSSDSELDNAIEKWLKERNARSNKRKDSSSDSELSGNKRKRNYKKANEKKVYKRNTARKDGYPKRVYVTDSGKCFHRKSCSALGEDYSLRSTDAVQAEGYHACSICFYER